MYVLTSNQQVEKYPYSIGQLRKDNPQVSFPRNPSDALLASYGVFPVYETLAVYDDATQVVTPQGCAYNDAQGCWETRWSIRDKTAEELAQDRKKLQDRITRDVQQRLDDFAATRNYAGIVSACTYATSTVPKFAAEGQYCVEARDATWSKCYELLAEVEAGTRPVPSGYADIEKELPVLAWPV